MAKHFYLLDAVARMGKVDAHLIDVLKYELDKRIYLYGDQFRFPRERVRNADSFKRRIRKLRGDLLKRQKVKRAFRSVFPAAKKIVSNAYFSVNDELRKNGYMVYSPHWGDSHDSSFLPDVRLLTAYVRLREVLDRATFAELLSEQTSAVIHDFVASSMTAYQSIGTAALIVPNDLNVWERIAIEQFKEMGKPSFTFLHGLPGRYNRLDESRSDLFVVRGEKIKENYVKAGHNPHRILVSGHPEYRRFANPAPSHSLGNILVLTKSMQGAQHSDKVVVSDRGSLVAYLYSLQNVLSSLGVKRVDFVLIQPKAAIGISNMSTTIFSFWIRKTWFNRSGNRALLLDLHPQ